MITTFQLIVKCLAAASLAADESPQQVAMGRERQQGISRLKYWSGRPGTSVVVQMDERATLPTQEEIAASTSCVQSLQQSSMQPGVSFHAPYQIASCRLAAKKTAEGQRRNRIFGV